MAIKYVQLTVSIHGLDADSEMLDFLKGWVREATKAGLLGDMRDFFNFRDEFEDDITVEVTEVAGK